MKQTCGQLIVDINGPKKGPNYQGRDIFIFLITNGKGALLYPSRWVRWIFMGMDISWHKGTPQVTDDTCSQKSDNPATSGRNGGSCAGRIMEKSWQVDYLN
ncbi:MAG: hypothetical protein MZV64_27735 [Ignavibacteriales bacterium]|nr:hypothetical protein [Ignavibacteriales bacterium]